MSFYYGLSKFRIIFFETILLNTTLPKTIKVALAALAIIFLIK